jgi:hypothetical protein
LPPPMPTFRLTRAVTFFTLVTLLALAMCGFGSTLAACDTRVMWFRYADAGADADVDGGADAGQVCDIGECIKRPSGWDGPLWAWIGPNPALIGSEEAPNCPLGDSDREGYTDLAAPEECAQCSCLPSTGSCELPSKLTASTDICGAGTPTIPFDAPASWGGTCDATIQVPTGVAKSLTIAPLTVTQESCAVGLDPPAAGVVTPYWKTLARTCVGDDWDECGGPHWYCIDKSQAPFPGARLCVLQSGRSLEDCNADWPEKYVLHQQGIDDERKCTECTCAPPLGSMCTALLSVYENSAACSGPAVFNQLPISSTSPGPCFDLSPPGKPMGSKLATSPTYIPGTCEAVPGSFIPDGGTLTVTPSFTLCCKP